MVNYRSKYLSKEIKANQVMRNNEISDVCCKDRQHSERLEKSVFVVLVNLGELVYNFSENYILFHNRVCPISFDKYLVQKFRDLHYFASLCSEWVLKGPFTGKPHDIEGYWF